jgi:hypothetical protein
LLFRAQGVDENLRGDFGICRHAPEYRLGALRTSNLCVAIMRKAGTVRAPLNGISWNSAGGSA